MSDLKDKLEKLVSEGKTQYDIAKIYNKSQGTVSNWFKKYNIKPNRKTGGSYNTKDLVGKRFGKYTVVSLFAIGKHGKEYLCKCDCGKEKIVRGSVLTSGKIQGCGCSKGNTHTSEDFYLKYKKHIGEKYNKLEIIDVDNKTKYRINYMICKCDCGNITKQKYADLKSGKVKSCGCYQKEQASITGSTIGMNNYKNNYNWYFIKEGKKINCRSGYEVLYANYLILNNIDFSYEPKTFKLSNGKRYTPDFYLIEEDKFIEIKGSFKVSNSNQRENIELFKNEHNIQILYWDDLYIECSLPFKSYHTYIRKAKNSNIKEEDYLANKNYLICKEYDEKS